MSDAWDFGVAAGIQLLRAGISYLKVDTPYVLDAVAFSLAVLEGSILSNTLPDRRRLTLYPAVMLVLRILLDFISGANNKNAIWGVAGTLGGLLLGPVFHGPDASSASPEQAAKAGPSAASSAGKAPSLFGGASTIRGLGTPLSTPRRVSSPPKPVMHHVVDVDKEIHQPILFTPAMSLRSLDEPSTMMLGSDGRSRTRVEDSFSSDDVTIKYEHYIVGDDDPSIAAGETIYQDALDTTSHGPQRQRQQKQLTVKDSVRKLRAQAKNDDLNRRNLLQEREQVLQDGDVARAFLLKHQAETLKKSMMESDQEAARTIFEYYNPPGRRELSKVDLRGLQASEAIKYCDDALKELQDAGGNMLVVTVGKGKNVEGTGKGKVKPTLRQYAKAQGIKVEESDEGSVLILTLPTLQSPVAYA